LSNLIKKKKSQKLATEVEKRVELSFWIKYAEILFINTLQYKVPEFLEKRAL